jgi:hypothetical protein
VYAISGYFLNSIPELMLIFLEVTSLKLLKTLKEMLKEG